MPEEKPELREILSRLERVERENRTLKRVGLAVVVLLAVPLIMGQTKSDRTLEVDTLKASKIVAGDIFLSDSDGNTTNLVPGNMIAATKAGSFVLISASQEGPSVRLFGNQGFETRLGVSSLQDTKTGESRQTSAASIVLTGKEKVLWSAP